MAEEVFIGLGANLGEAKANLRFAWDELARLAGYRPLALSSPYLTAPVGPQDQPPFWNAVGRGIFEGTARELLQALLAIEKTCGRVRDRRWGPRTLDLDLLLFGRQSIDQPDLVVPHPRLHQRAFVLVPLAELAPELILPRWERTASQLLEALDPAERDRQKVEKKTWA